MRDVNDLSHWALNDAAHFAAAAAVPTLGWDPGCRALMLKRAADVPPSGATKAAMRAVANVPAVAADDYGTWAFVAAGAPGQIRAAGGGLGDAVIFEAGPGREVVDFDWSARGDLLVLWRAGAQRGLIWADRQDRFDPVSLDLGGVACDRVSVAPDLSAMWLLARGSGRLMRVEGAPLLRPLADLRRPDVGFDPTPVAADPPRVTETAVTWPDGAAVLGMVALNDGALAVLREGLGATGLSRLDWRFADGRVATMALEGVTRAFSLCSYAGDRVAVVAPDWPEARVYDPPLPDTPDGLPTLPGPERIPLRGWTGARLCGGGTVAGFFPRGTADAPQVARLAPLSFAAHADTGEIALDPIDSGADGFVWHRIYLEADLPRGTGIELRLSASDDGSGGAESRHVFGDAATGDGSPARGVWVDLPSEHAHGRNHLPEGVDRVQDRTGLFTCLVQADRPGDSRIAGRVLRATVRLTGTGSATPRLFALRVWGPRFSYREKYLPELYTITEGPGAGGSDFLDRYLGLFESVFSPLEAQIAETWRGASAASAPATSLDWLGGWLGLTLDSALGETGKRRTIASAAEQSQWHGTLRGLEHALDIATDGGMRRSQVVVVENFKMRRTFATILGADLDDADDPMTRGTRANANSVLGPNFHMGHADEKRLFALFSPDLLEHPLTSPEERREAALQLAQMDDAAIFRVTVLVHDSLTPDQIGLVRNVVARSVPAHVRAKIVDAPRSLLLGLTALLGVETRLGARSEPAAFTLDETELGQSRLRGLPALDQHLER